MNKPQKKKHSASSLISPLIREFAEKTKEILKDNITAEYLFGSVAKNTQTEDSDIDILIIVKKLKPGMQRQVSALASDYSLAHNVLFSPMIKDLDGWKKNEYYETLFYKEVTEHGVLL